MKIAYPLLFTIPCPRAPLRFSVAPGLITSSNMEGVPEAPLISTSQAHCISLKEGHSLILEDLYPDITDFIRNNFFSDEAIIYLKNEKIPYEDRIKELKNYLFASVLFLNSLNSVLSQDDLVKIANPIAMCKINTKIDGAHAGMRFGLKTCNSSKKLFGTIFHELGHKVLDSQFSFAGLGKLKSTEQSEVLSNFAHEGHSDWLTLFAISKLSNSEEDFNKFVEEHLDELARLDGDNGNQYKIVHEDFKGYASDEHLSSRAIMINLINLIRQSKLSLKDIAPIVYDKWFETIKDFKENGIVNIPDTITFTNRLCEKLNPLFTSNGVKLVVKDESKKIEDKDIVEFKIKLRSMFEQVFKEITPDAQINSEDIIQWQLSQLVKVPKIYIKSKS